MTATQRLALAFCLGSGALFAAGYTGLTELQVGYYRTQEGTLEASLVVDQVTDQGFHLILYNEKSLAKKCLVEGNANYQKGSRYEAALDWRAPEGATCHYKVSLAPSGLSVVTLSTIAAPCSAICDKTLFPTERSFSYQYPGCTARQIVTRRDDYKRLYDRKKFDEAYEVLNYTYDHCLAYVDPDAEAWLYSDLALAALKKGDAKKCLEVLDEYEGVKTAPNPKVAKALELNKQLCKEKTGR